MDFRHLDVWQEIASAHYRTRSYGLRGLKLLWHPHDYISVFMKTYAWKETFSLLDGFNDADLEAVTRYADVNLKIAAEQLKRVGIW